ncbi:HNH endonuclease family protein [Mycobacterium marinum]|uniref:HNH endonuclease family protein n=1 Tax=Mycobacterium marinum TaxID=1781 RepID=UPI0021C4793B|nr:HNH endonuclease family protein [Mycobacterium marinum]MDC8972822.1 HNH endonuclease family protein [Mycobacterium marinum]
MNRKMLLWLSVAALLAVLVAYQSVRASTARHAEEFAARAGVPTVQPGTDVLAGIGVLPRRMHRYDYRRVAFGAAWDDNNDAPGGHNGCDTRDDILDRDLVDKTYVVTKRCPNAVATGTLHDPYTNTIVVFQRGARVGQSVQIDHIVPLSYAWDMGASDWPAARRLRFANDPANLLAVQGHANQDKGDSPPAGWMPPNAAFACQYAMQFIAVLRGYALPVDRASSDVLRQAAATCPTG